MENVPGLSIPVNSDRNLSDRSNSVENCDIDPKRLNQRRISIVCRDLSETSNQRLGAMEDIMGKGLGIAVLIVAAFAIIIPLYGIYLGLITAALGIVVAALKEPAMAIAIGALNILDAVFLTPSLKVANAGAQMVHSSTPAIIFWTWVSLGAVSIIVAIAVGRTAAIDRSAASA